MQAAADDDADALVGHAGRLELSQEAAQHRRARTRPRGVRHGDGDGPGASRQAVERGRSQRLGERLRQGRVDVRRRPHLGRRHIRVRARHGQARRAAEDPRAGAAHEAPGLAGEVVGSDGETSTSAACGGPASAEGEGGPADGAAAGRARSGPSSTGPP